MKKEKDCGILLKQICDKLETSANNELKNSGLTLSQVRYLEYLYERHPAKVHLKELEAAFEVKQPTVLGIITRLEKKGLVRTEQSAEDSRAKTVCMTEMGYQNFCQGEKHRQNMECQILEPLSKQERSEFQRLLQIVNEHLM